MTPDNFRLLAFTGGLSLMFLVESLWPARAWQTPRWKRLSFHLILSLTNSLLLRAVLVFPLLSLVQWTENHAWGLRHLFGLRGVLEILLTLVFFDAFDYWWHRFNHRWPFLWRFHRVHHIDTHVDVTTSLRFHPGELFLSAGARALWILAWGPSLWAYVLGEAGITAFSQFHHSNIRFRPFWERVVRWVYMTPTLHVSHHTLANRSRNGNFSTIFLVWDRLFGTLREPDSKEMETLGLPIWRERYLTLACILQSPLREEGSLNGQAS